MAHASQASPSERFPIPPYPENVGTQQGELLNFSELQPLKTQFPDGGTGLAARGGVIPAGGRLEWKIKDQDLLVDSGYMEFPLAIGDSQGVQWTAPEEPGERTADHQCLVVFGHSNRGIEDAKSQHGHGNWDAAAVELGEGRPD